MVFWFYYFFPIVATWRFFTIFISQNLQHRVFYLLVFGFLLESLAYVGRTYFYCYYTSSPTSLKEGNLAGCPRRPYRSTDSCWQWSCRTAVGTSSLWYQKYLCTAHSADKVASLIVLAMLYSYQLFDANVFDLYPFDDAALIYAIATANEFFFYCFFCAVGNRCLPLVCLTTRLSEVYGSIYMLWYASTHPAVWLPLAKIHKT